MQDVNLNLNQTLSFHDESDTSILDKNVVNSLASPERIFNSEIVTRKELFLKESQIILKTIQTQSEVHLHKKQGLFKKIIRDSVLLLFVTVSFILINSYTHLTNEKVKLFSSVFYVLLIYLVISIAYQGAMSIVDTIISKNELIHWRDTTKGLFRDIDVAKYIEEPLAGIKNCLRFFFPFMIMIYIAFAYGCYKLPEFIYAWKLYQ